MDKLNMQTTNQVDENNRILIYTDSSGVTKIDVRMSDDTLWLTQAQMCELYQTNKSNVSEHIKHIFEEGELNRDMVVRKFRTTTQHGAIKAMKAYARSHFLQIRHDYCTRLS